MQAVIHNIPPGLKVLTGLSFDGFDGFDGLTVVHRFPYRYPLSKLWPHMAGRPAEDPMGEEKDLK